MAPGVHAAAFAALTGDQFPNPWQSPYSSTMDATHQAGAGAAMATPSGHPPNSVAMNAAHASAALPGSLPSASYGNLPSSFPHPAPTPLAGASPTLAPTSATAASHNPAATLVTSTSPNPTPTPLMGALPNPWPGVRIDPQVAPAIAAAMTGAKHKGKGWRPDLTTAVLKYMMNSLPEEEAGPPMPEVYNLIEESKRVLHAVKASLRAAKDEARRAAEAHAVATLTMPTSALEVPARLGDFL